MLHVIKRKLTRFMALPSADRGVFVSAAALMPLFRLAIRYPGLARFMNWIEGRTRCEPTRLALPEVRALARLVNQAGAHSPGGANCLTRSLLLKWLLLRRGVECQLRIGVRTTGKVLEAHAWIDYEGEPINDRPENCAAFTAFEKPISFAPAAKHFL